MSSKNKPCSCVNKPASPASIIAPPKPVQELTGGELNLEVLRCIEDVGAAELEIGILEAAIADHKARILKIRQRENMLHNERRRREIKNEQI